MVCVVVVIVVGTVVIVVVAGDIVVSAIVIGAKLKSMFIISIKNCIRMYRYRRLFCSRGVEIGGRSGRNGIVYLGSWLFALYLAIALDIAVSARMIKGLL